MRTMVLAAVSLLALAGGSFGQGNGALRDVRVVQVEPTVVPNRDKEKDEIDGKAVRVFIYEGKASLTRQR